MTTATLTTEQAEKLARGWVWMPWQQAVNSAGARWRIEDADRLTLRRLRINGYGPDLRDDVTRDGFLRTLRSMWRDPNAFAMRSQSGKWKVFARSGHEEHVFEGATEEAALLAACLAAPEAT